MSAWTQRGVRGLIIVAATLLLYLAYQAYQQPGLLLDFLNLRYCG